MNEEKPVDALPQETEALFACVCLLQGNYPKREVADVAFVPGLAVDNWQADDGDDGVLETAATLVPAHAARIAIPGYTGTYPEGLGGTRSATGYPGGECWRGELLRLGVPAERIIFYAEDDVGPDGKSWNTRTETDAFVSTARERAWVHACVVATPFHLPRVMLTLVRSVQYHVHHMRLNPICPRSCFWGKAVYHSQGLKRLPRHAHIQEEWNRIPRYQANGSIASFEEVGGLDQRLQTERRYRPRPCNRCAGRTGAL